MPGGFSVPLLPPPCPCSHLSCSRAVSFCVLSRFVGQHRFDATADVEPVLSNRFFSLRSPLSALLEQSRGLDDDMTMDRTCRDCPRTPTRYRASPILGIWYQGSCFRKMRFCAALSGGAMENRITAVSVGGMWCAKFIVLAASASQPASVDASRQGNRPSSACVGHVKPSVGLFACFPGCASLSRTLSLSVSPRAEPYRSPPNKLPE